MSWPLSQDYNEAIQSPRGNFSDPDLEWGVPVTNPLGIPLPCSGNFADVYELRCPGGDRWAVKCFTRQMPGLRERYAAISRHLAQLHLPFIVDFTFLEQGIRVRGRWYPILKMQWVEGLTLNEFVRQYADKPAMLKNLLHIWVRMAARLREAGIAHADLQHGNVLLVPGSTANSLAVKLVDYDGMFVPALAGGDSGEVGHPCYQHPQRLAERTYSLEVDRFPLLLVATALDCLRVGGRALWDKYDSGDNLLFREADLRASVKSPLFYELLKLGDERASRLVRHTLDALKGRLESVSLLEELLPELYAPPAAKPAAVPGKPMHTTVVEAAAAQSAAETQVVARAAVANSAWDFEGEDEPRSPRRRKVGRLRWVWGVAAAGVAALVLSGGIFSLAFRGETEKPKDKKQIAQNKPEKPPQRPGKSPEQVASKEEQPDGARQGDGAASPLPAPPEMPERSNESEGQERVKTTYLSEMNYLDKRHASNYFSTDGTISGVKFVVDGNESPHGIFLHPASMDTSEISYKLGRKWATFLCGVAVPRRGDKEEERGLCLGGALSFEVVGDDDVLWMSKPVRDFDQSQRCEVNVEKVDVLRLRVRCPGHYWCARAVWIEPRVTTTKELPRKTASREP